MHATLKEKRLIINVSPDVTKPSYIFNPSKLPFLLDYMSESKSLISIINRTHTEKEHDMYNRTVLLISHSHYSETLAPTKAYLLCSLWGPSISGVTGRRMCYCMLWPWSCNTPKVTLIHEHTRIHRDADRCFTKPAPVIRHPLRDSTHAGRHTHIHTFWKHASTCAHTCMQILTEKLFT